MRSQQHNNGGDMTMGTGASCMAKEIASSKNNKEDAKKSGSVAAFRFRTNTVLIYAVALVAVIFAFSSYSDMYGVSAGMRSCPTNVDNTEPTDCVHGVITNFCGRRVCAKGPGDPCGTGMFKMLGTCGDGMYCNCGRCIGCSLATMTCFDKTCTK